MGEKKTKRERGLVPFFLFTFPKGIPGGEEEKKIIANEVTCSTVVRYGEYERRGGEPGEGREVHARAY